MRCQKSLFSIVDSFAIIDSEGGLDKIYFDCKIGLIR